MSDKTIVVDADGETVTVTKAPPRVFVDFTRTLNLGDYNSAKASVNIEAAVDLDASPEDIAYSVKQAFFLAKAAVFEQLGVEYDVNYETTLIVEKLAAAGLSAVEVTPAAVQAAVNDAANRPAAKSSDKAAAWANLLADPNGWFDNRTSKRGKQPDFKAKNTNKAIEGGTALWLDSKDTPQEAKERFAA